ncbi:hypothetical protein T484DRAFT_1861747 [Baffinella frigidus]|nr:hypothetical protein T484DRAFT_1861747 [Cryptophyta sp. CCMP2293]
MDQDQACSASRAFLTGSGPALSMSLLGVANLRKPGEEAARAMGLSMDHRESDGGSAFSGGAGAAPASDDAGSAFSGGAGAAPASDDAGAAHASDDGSDNGSDDISDSEDGVAGLLLAGVKLLPPGHCPPKPYKKKNPDFKAAPSKLYHGKEERVDWRPYVPVQWVREFVSSVPVFTVESTNAYRVFLEREYGMLYTKVAGDQAIGLPEAVVRKLQIIDYMVVRLQTQPCQDKRLDSSKPVIELQAVHGESFPENKGYGFICGRSVTFNDPLAFNLVMRWTQTTHKSWPSGGALARGTKGITEPLSVIGLGPSTNARAWNVRNGNYRGFENTDPSNAWPLKPGQDPEKRETDGIYFYKLSHTFERLEKEVLRGRCFMLDSKAARDAALQKKAKAKAEKVKAKAEKAKAKAEKAGGKAAEKAAKKRKAWSLNPEDAAVAPKAPKAPKTMCAGGSRPYVFMNLPPHPGNSGADVVGDVGGSSGL